MDVPQLYQDRIAHLTAEQQQLERYDLMFSVFRVVLVFFGFLGWWQATQWPWGKQLAIVSASAFVLMVILHHRLAEGQQRNRRRLAYVLGAQQRGLGQIPAMQHRATQSYKDHLFHEALELHAPTGLLSAIGPTASFLGQQQLEQLLLTAVEPKIILARQQAVQQLAPCHLARETMAGFDPQHDLTAHRLMQLQRWLGYPQAPFHKGWLRCFGLLHVGFALSLLGIVYKLPYAHNALLMILISHWLCHRWLASAVQQYGDLLQGWEKALERLQQLMQMIHTLPVQGDVLQDIHTSLWQHHRASRQSLRRLQRRITWLNLRHHALLQPLLGLFFALPYAVWSLYQWRREYAQHVWVWLEQIGLADSLLTLGGYQLNHPSDSWPTFLPQAQAPYCRIQAIAHPLLPRAQVVHNDVELTAQQPLMILSGSNMSGKSTLLRAIAINSALMYAGAPVRAKSWQASPYQIATSLHIQDNLLEGISRFYAELLRLKAIVQADQAPLQIFFLLDEILAGTNSTDRQLGTAAILRQLLQDKAFGIVTTHDLALTHLPQLQPQIQCWHFTDLFEQEKLQYDYKLRPGVVTSTHTPALLYSLGLLSEQPQPTTLEINNI